MERRKPFKGVKKSLLKRLKRRRGQEWVSDAKEETKDGKWQMANGKDGDWKIIWGIDLLINEEVCPSL